MVKKYTSPKDYYEQGFLKSKMVVEVLDGIPLLKDIDELNGFCATITLLLKEGKNPANGWYKRIANFKKYNIHPHHWESKVKDILNIMKDHGCIPMTYNNQKLLYGYNEGKKRWEKYLKQQARTNTLEYKQEKYGWTEEQFNEYNKSRAVTIENMINRHGEEEGTKLWLEYCDKQAYTNTLDYFIEREGSKEKGLEFFLNYNQEKAKSHDPLWIMEKYNVDMDEALEILSARHTPSFTSEGEKYFIDLLEHELGEQIKYTYKTKQFCVWSHELDAPLFYDAVCSKRKKAIEYNGDYWHANPLLHEADTVIKQKGMTAKEIWERDRIKIKALVDRGYEIKIIWESDFLKDENIIKEVAEWLQ